MWKTEWGAESNGKLPHLSIPSKTATWVLEFAVEDLPLARTSALMSELAVKDLPLGRAITNDDVELIKKRKINWLGYWLRKDSLLKDALEGIVNGKKVRGWRRYQMIDNIMINGLFEYTKRRAEKRVEWRMLSLQWKTSPWAEQNNCYIYIYNGQNLLIVESTLKIITQVLKFLQKFVCMHMNRDHLSGIELKVLCSSRFGFYDLLISQVISVAFYSEREKSEKFCSEALISAWGSFTYRKSTTRDPQLYSPSEGSHIQDFYALKKSIDSGRVWTWEPRIQWRVW